MVKCIAFNEAESEFWYKCSHAPACNTYFNSFKPQPHQYSVLVDAHKFIGNFGGFGSAKTYATRQSVYKQLFISTKATVLISANVASQYEQTIKREIEADIPKEFVKEFNRQKQYMELYNGSRILYRPLDDVDKLRSMNLSAWYIIEGSEVSPEAFTQLKTRLRNMAAAEWDGKSYVVKNGIRVPDYKYFHGLGMVESNPDSGWIRDEILFRASDIVYHGSALQKYHPDKDADPAISCHISATDCNAYLPDGYIEQNCAGKPQWWIERFIFGSFEFAHGLCCPKYADNIVPTFVVPNNWVKLISYDPGLVDPSAFVNVAVDPIKGIAYAYRDHQYKDCSVKQLAQLYWTQVAFDITHGQLYCQPIMDGKMFGRRMFTDKSTLNEQWANYGVYFKPGHISVKDRLWRINTYFEEGRLKIMDCCENLVREFKDYKYKPQVLGKPTKEEPIDRNNHSIDALQWICMELPENPADLVLGAFDSSGAPLDKPADGLHCPQLMDDPEEYTGQWEMWSSYV